VKSVKKYGFFVASFLSLFCFIIYYNSVFYSDHKAEFQSFQEDFLREEVSLNAYLDSKISSYRDKNLKYVQISSEKDEYNLHIYRNDSLIYWNTNKLPILRFADIHFPSDGIVKLQNGWYFAKIKEIHGLKFVASFLIKKEYSYENDYLTNEFDGKFKLPFEAQITLDKEKSFPVLNNKKEFSFALQEAENQKTSILESNLLTLLFVLFLGLFLLGIYKKLIQIKPTFAISIAFVMLVLQYFLLRLNSYAFLDQISLFEPSLYASSNWFPNLFMLLINSFFVLFFISVVSKFIIENRSKLFLIIIYGFSFLFTLLISNVFQSLVKDSSIPIEIEKLFKLDINSLWAAISIGIFFYAYFVLIRAIFYALQETKIKKSIFISIFFTFNLIYFFLDHFYFSKLISLSSWPLVLDGIILFIVFKSHGKFNFNYGLLLLLVFSFFISYNIHVFYEQKEKSERELFASQLASDQDVSAEYEFLNLSPLISEDPYFQKLFQNPRLVSVSEFKDFMERKYFTEFWERFELDYYLFEKNNPLINHVSSPNSTREYFEGIIKKHSFISELSPEIFYIKDYTSQLSYVIKKQIYNSDSTRFFTLYTSLKTKRIPEKIGFPRLLISNQSNVFKAIENYSLAKYYKGKLVSQYGKFSYPTEDYLFSKQKKNSSAYFDYENYNHYYFKKNSRDLIVLSQKIHSNFQLLTSFSYLFCFYGFSLICILALKNSQNLNFSNVTLAFKIQLILVSIVIIALLFFGFGSGKFVSNQYNDYSTELIKEKIKSVQFEVKSKLGKEKKLSIELQGDFMQAILQKFANVFVTDINLYDKKGYILASSRPKVFNKGLMSEQINSLAYLQLNFSKKSEFIHQENIGNLNYLSAYVPLFNNEGKFLAYINLQHFGQQQGFENQIEGFLVAIINVFILLLVFSIILSILISNWLTSPLKILQNSFAKVQIGKYNEPIVYHSKDEIGALVKNYNEKLEELAFTAQQLAQSERESAWREMAKQVAHEIKNPLTPMKLSLQHLQRIYDPDDPNSKLKLDKVVSSIVEQIDSLTKIANEFSNFAKMPKENKSQMDVLPLIEHVYNVFEQEIEIEIINKAKNTLIFGDKDLLLRVFNNLIKNAIQAIPENRTGLIKIRLQQDGNNLLLEIEDNGKGIPEEMWSKIFMPNFTTKSTGMGLGLAMVKQIIQLHEGEIWFESIENKTIFFIRLPLLRQN
jgi:two-component system nitrogen regulation sensor histidine kinase NtrY